MDVPGHSDLAQSSCMGLEGHQGGGEDCTNRSAPCDCQNEVGNANWEWGIPSIEKGTTVENISQFWVTSDQLHLQVGIHVICKVGRVLTKC